MSGGEWAAIVGAQVCLVLLVVLVVMIVRLDHAVRELRAAASDFRREARPALDELRAAVHAADFELDRVHAIVTGAEKVTGRVDAASDLAYRTFTSPVVKALAVGSGTKRAVQRLRGDRPQRRAGSVPERKAGSVPERKAGSVPERKAG